MSILILEDSATIAKALSHQLTRSLGEECVVASTLREAETLFQRGSRFSAAICGMQLPDAPDGQAIQRLRELKIATVVFTSSVDESHRESMWRLGIVDYVLKQGADMIGQVVDLVRGLSKNPATHVLVVDDSALARMLAGNLLRTRNFTVHEAPGGAEALEVLEKHPEVRLMITDYEMPGLNGIELIREVRKTRTMEKLGIVGMSSLDNRTTVSFLKNGADDYLIKPFLAEEFLARVTRLLQAQENLVALRKMATTDLLTGLSNRRSFLADVRDDLEKTEGEFKVAIFDIDHFKNVNDTHGHDAGDLVLIEVARRMRDTVAGSGRLARWGGEEFVLLAPASVCGELSEKVRRALEASEVRAGEGLSLGITASCGVSDPFAGGIEANLSVADTRLYLAKQGGRNRVVVAD